MNSKPKIRHFEVKHEPTQGRIEMAPKREHYNYMILSLHIVMLCANVVAYG